jgi:hypothetical protein
MRDVRRQADLAMNRVSAGHVTMIIPWAALDPAKH